MSESAQALHKKDLPMRIRRELRQGETIYHSTMLCHVSAKFPVGKWIAQVRRDERAIPVKYPVKGFGTPMDALAFIRSLRPDAKGKVSASRQGEPTVAELNELVRSQRKKRIGESTKGNQAWLESCISGCLAGPPGAGGDWNDFWITVIENGVLDLVRMEHT